MSTEIQSVGNLSDTPLLQLFRWVTENHYSGVMILAHDEVKKSIIFEKGQIISARSNIMSECLGQLLLAQGKITQAQLTQSLTKTDAQESMRHGEVLIAMGLIDHALLNDFLRRQVEVRIEEIFSWKEGKYGFVEKIPEDAARVKIEGTLLEIALRGLIRRYLKQEDTKALSLDLKPISIGGHGIEIEQLKLVGREMSLLRAVSGVSTMKDIITKSRMDEPMARAMFLAFRDFGMIRIGDTAPQTSPSTRSTPPPPRESSKPAPAPSSATASKPSTPAPQTPATKGFNPEEIADRLAAAQTQTLFDLLGVPRQATTDDIKKAYFDLARKYHPDRLPPNMSPEDRKNAEALFARITEAQTRLTNPSSRKEYEASLELEASGVGSGQVNAVLESEAEFQKGTALLRKGDFKGAMEAYQKAISLYEKEPEYFSQLGWAMFRQSAKTKNAAEHAKAKRAVETSIKMNPNLAQSYYYLGMITKTDGDLEMAKKLFNKAVEMNPKNAEATSELRLINSRLEKEHKGGLKGLFKKKEA